jgi:hypothetical protein
MSSSINAYNHLVDIRNIVVNKDLTKQQRVAEFARQIKNPYRFRCGNFIITANFTEGGPSLEDCLQRIIA